jgi:hypothetical protein
VKFLRKPHSSWLEGDFDPSASYHDWVPMKVPSAWEQHPSGAFADYDGFGWYRSYVHVPESWRGSRLLLVVDEVSDVDEGFFNGIKIGANGAMPPLYQNPSSNIRRPFVIDPDWIRYGEDNLIAWRVYDKGGQGGILKGPVHLSRRDDAIDLEGTWLFRPGDAPLGVNGITIPAVLKPSRILHNSGKSQEPDLRAMAGLLMRILEGGNVAFRRFTKSLKATPMCMP